MGVHGFKGLGWFLCGAIVAPACYLVNSHGAAEQAKLNATRLAIVQAQRDIRGLETEFNTRANMAQLERWNGEVLALAAPAPQQYLASETALASLDRQPTDIQVAALVMPAGAPAMQAASQVVVPAATPVQQAPQAVAPAKTGAQQDGELRKLMKKADRQAIASVDRSVLSAGTIDDLQKLAKREKLALR
ncbi:hypothetical protein MZO42_01090 [Sphingomonas psychrotolerans]|uniref:Colicin transporter n=1 Tax=Sphingomonas psychrotolerans TaxID=1327635 RepID=A0ABU3N230_9SPHN|nr:hypothetical protein [Sphingomonas psychrotolerans]MDT8757280.1 hypothetical protein [Sphingomonas psychrotolerans]